MWLTHVKTYQNVKTHFNSYQTLEEEFLDLQFIVLISHQREDMDITHRKLFVQTPPTLQLDQMAFSASSTSASSFFPSSRVVLSWGDPSSQYHIIFTNFVRGLHKAHSSHLNLILEEKPFSRFFCIFIFTKINTFFKIICTVSPWLIYLTWQAPLGTNALEPSPRGGGSASLRCNKLFGVGLRWLRSCVPRT